MKTKRKAQKQTKQTTIRRLKRDECLLVFTNTGKLLAVYSMVLGKLLCQTLVGRKQVTSVVYLDDLRELMGKQ